MKCTTKKIIRPERQPFFNLTTKARKFRHIGHIEIEVHELNDFGTLCDFQLCQEVSALIKKSSEKL